MLVKCAHVYAQAMWHSEMYGYVFAAAQVGVTHKVRRRRAALGSGPEPPPPPPPPQPTSLPPQPTSLTPTRLVKVRRDVMLYPGYQPFLGRAPMVLHYGSDFTVDGAYFNKVFTCLCRPCRRGLPTSCYTVLCPRDSLCVCEPCLTPRLHVRCISYVARVAT